MPIKRLNMKKILADPDARRKLMVSTIQAVQARENIETTPEQAERAYYVVTEAERAAFFGLDSFRDKDVGIDARHTHFVRSLRGDSFEGVFKVGFRDFQAIDGAPLAFSRIAAVAHVFRENPLLEPSFADARRGGCTGNDSKLVRYWWETKCQEFVPFAKGGPFSRFYCDVFLRVWWDCQRQTFRGFTGRKGRETERPEALDYYFRKGLTWPRRTAKGLNVRRMPEGCVFADKGPSIFVREDKSEDYLLAVTNTHLFEYLFRTKTSFSWEVGIMKAMPIPHPTLEQRDKIGSYARLIHDAKANWDTSNEICTRFSRPWLLRSDLTEGASTFAAGLDAVLATEAREDAFIQQAYAELNNAVYKLYGITERNRTRIEESLGERPTELIWPQMEGKTLEQKRLEHIYRVLSYAVKEVLDADEDGIIPFQQVASETPLLDRVLRRLAGYFPGEDSHRLEIAIVNELKIKVKGYKKVESIAAWLNNQCFDHHCGLYQNRPIRWHLASSRDPRREPAFSALVDYHKFDQNRLAKLRSTYVKEFLDTLRKNAALAGKENREADRLDYLEKAEEVAAFDEQLAGIEEGRQEGVEGGDRDYRILTPWKSPAERPRGWNPDIDDGVKVNIAPFVRAGVLRTKAGLGVNIADTDD